MPTQRPTQKPTTADWRGFGEDGDAGGVSRRNDVNVKATMTMTTNHHRRQTTRMWSRSAEDEEVPGRAKSALRCSRSVGGHRIKSTHDRAVSGGRRPIARRRGRSLATRRPLRQGRWCCGRTPFLPAGGAAGLPVTSCIWRGVGGHHGSRAGARHRTSEAGGATTSGGQKEVYSFLATDERIVRPAQLPRGRPRAARPT